MATCPECNGARHVPLFISVRTCPTCGGTGKAPEQEPLKPSSSCVEIGAAQELQTLRWTGDAWTEAIFKQSGSTNLLQATPSGSVSGFMSPLDKIKLDGTTISSGSLTFDPTEEQSSLHQTLGPGFECLSEIDQQRMIDQTVAWVKGLAPELQNVGEAYVVAPMCHNVMADLLAMLEQEGHAPKAFVCSYRDFADVRKMETPHLRWVDKHAWLYGYEVLCTRDFQGFFFAVADNAIAVGNVTR